MTVREMAPAAAPATASRHCGTCDVLRGGGGDGVFKLPLIHVLYSSNLVLLMILPYFLSNHRILFC